MRIAAVVIAHNVAEWIGQALRSVLDQHRAVDALVVVENGSTDETEAVIRRTLESPGGATEGITVLSEDRLGPGGARNRGVEAALERGADAVAFLDGDDWWSTSFVARLEAALSGDAGSVGAFGWTVVRDAEGGFRSLRARRHRTYDYADLCRIKSPMVTTSSLMVKADRLIECGGFRTDITCGEDWEMLLRLTRPSGSGDAGPRVRCVPRFLVNYRKRAGSLTTEARRAVNGMMAVESSHPRARQARHWWWPLNLALRSGQWELVDEIASLRPEIRPADLLSAQFVKYLGNRLLHPRPSGEAGG